MSLKNADKYFSLYIRIRDASENGIIFCIACGKPVFWKYADAGHFIKRQYKSTRFNEKNVNAECRHCNWLLQGNDINYAKGLEKKYGEGIIEQLEAAKNRAMKMGRFEQKHIAGYYRYKFNQLKKLKGL